MIYRHQRNYGCRVHDRYCWDGMRTVVLENDKIRVSLLPDKGTDVFELLLKSRDLDYVWLTDNGLTNPQRTAAIRNERTSFIDSYEGGWQEVFPSGGAACVHEGVAFGQHEEVALLPWDYEIVEDTAERISVRFRVRTRKMPFAVSKTVSLAAGSSRLEIRETVTNLSGEPLRYMWGQHLAFGRPFLEEGCVIELPEALTVIADERDVTDGRPGRVRRGRNASWPYAEGPGGERVDLSVLPPAGTPSDIVYLTGFGDTGWYKVRNPKRSAAIRVEWDAVAMPSLWYWQEFGAAAQYPWYGRHYNIGLEPFAGYPTHGLAEAVRNGTAGAIGGGESRSFWMTAELLDEA